MYKAIYQSIDCIDEKQTIKNGKRVCNQYRPLIEKRRKQLAVGVSTSASIVTFSGNMKRNSYEEKLIKRCIWNEDQITNFINNIFELEKFDKIAGGFLKYKYIYDKDDSEIIKILSISQRTLDNHKKDAYYNIALWSNQVEFIYNEKYYFELIT